ncbi:hypothetical protein SAMN05444274_105154 [Mariniphaga anaerophila]|uniref:Uncharacterized protein n=1 Tax=Mariniphaga anaerophila TaxID=1484053 RepID=A0A1M5BI37_9BACT|nr:hypothetical protein [Mariniphaga anaerophila]SHF42010.1 hypothetical protein SAMN05444274_105154 [Mariniphaga anaerophila]
MWHLFFVLVSLFVMPEVGQNSKIEEAVADELKYFPEARLRDIYKNFFQDAFGPGHLIPDTLHAGKYLNYELSQPIGDTLKWQAIGPANDYYRINLLLVKQGVLPRSVLLEAMVESAVLARKPGIDVWKKEWAVAMDVIQKMNLGLVDFESDKKAIEEILSKGEYVMHHSDYYNETYQRHYRIVHKTVFNRWKGVYF